MPARIETKVKASAGASFGAGILIALLNGAQDNPGLLAPLPSWAQAVVIAAAPPALAFLAGYQAPHTPRPSTTDTTQDR